MWKQLSFQYEGNLRPPQPEPLSEDELVGLEMAASVGDFGSSGDEIQRAVDEIREFRRAKGHSRS